MLLQNINHLKPVHTYRLSKKIITIEYRKMGYSFKQSFPLDWTAPPVDTLFLLSFSYLCKYNKTWKKSQNTGEQKKECAGLDRLNPLKSFFLSAPDGIFPRYHSRSHPVSLAFSVHYGHNQGTLPELSAPTLLSQPKTLQQPPFPWLLPKALGTALRQGKGNPWGCGLPCQRPSEIQSIRIDCL